VCAVRILAAKNSRKRIEARSPAAVTSAGNIRRRGCIGVGKLDLVMLPAIAAAGDRDAGSPVARLSAGSVPRRRAVRDRASWRASSAAPNSPAPSQGSLSAVANGCGKRRHRAHARRADAGAASAREIRTPGRPHNPTGPSLGSTPPAVVAFARAGRPEPGKGLMHSDNQSRELAGGDLVMPNVAADDVRNFIEIDP
jgi:hypothetical protein